MDGSRTRALDWMIDVLVGWIVGATAGGLLFDIIGALAGTPPESQSLLRGLGALSGTVAGILLMRRRRAWRWVTYELSDQHYSEEERGAVEEMLRRRSVPFAWEGDTIVADRKAEAAIDAVLDHLDSVAQQRRGLRVCASCGARAAADASFCQACGFRLAAPAAPR